MVAPSFDYEYVAVTSSGSPHTRDGQASTILELNFTSSNGIDMLGKAWGYSIMNYLITYPGMSDKWDAKVVEQWLIIGDPSLKIGGYNQL